MKIEYDDVTFNGKVFHSHLPYEPVDTFPNSATPDISAREKFIASGSVVSITNFLNGADGQTISICGDGTTTITNNANIVTNTGANVLMTLNKIYRFTYFLKKTKWIEDA